jgi:hypothetical protein
MDQGCVLIYCHDRLVVHGCGCGDPQGLPVRSTPARTLRKDQLLVERHAVHKITKVEYPLPQNTVTVELANQMTAQQSSRNLRWDEQVTTEEPLEVKIGETGKIRVELALQRDDHDRPLYKFHISDIGEGIDFASAGLQLGPRLRPDNVRAAKLLLTELSDSAEAWQAGHVLEADAFPEDVNVYVANHGAEIEMAQVELIRGLER